VVRAGARKEREAQSAGGMRQVVVMGWDGAECEVSGRHECLEHEDFETRASFSGRTLAEVASNPNPIPTGSF